MDSTGAVYIYGLVDPRNKETRYVGKSADPAQRLREHRWKCRKLRGWKDRWLASLLDAGVAPNLVILEECAESLWQDAERRWIALFRSQGHRLTNLTVGGEGGPCGEANGSRLHPENLARGANHPLAKITREQAVLALTLHAAGMRQRDIGKRLGIGQSGAGRILRGETWAEIRNDPDVALIPLTLGARAGSRRFSKKLTQDDAEAIRAAYENGETQKSIAMRYSISGSYVGRVVAGFVWSDRPHRYSETPEAERVPWQHKHPATIARGDRSGSRLHPESRPRGERQKFNMYPELRMKGEDNPAHKLTVDDVYGIIRLVSNGTSKAAVAVEYGVTYRSVQNIVVGKTWKHLPRP